MITVTTRSAHVLQLLQTYVRGFHAPPAATTAAVVTAVTLAAGWLAPHTSRPKLLTAEETAVLDRVRMARGSWEPPSGALPAWHEPSGSGGHVRPAPPPAVQPPATGTGPAKGDAP